MKKRLVFLAIFFVFGCASVQFNPETGSVSYTRMGDQHIQGLAIEQKGDGKYSVKLDSQQSEAQAMIELIRLIQTLAPGVTP